MPQAQLSPTSDEYILDLLGTCEQKLLKLMDDLGGKDINDVMKEMEDAEVMLKFSGYWPSFCWIERNVGNPTVITRSSPFGK